MAESILKIHTQNGDVPVGYPGLADKPIADKTLSVEGAFADSKAVGDKFKEVKTETDSLKKDLSNKITKFYASNQGETHITDSDNGKIQDMIIYGKSSQDGVPTPENPVEIKSVANPTVKVCGKNLIDTGEIKAFKNVTISNGTVKQATADERTELRWKAVQYDLKDNILGINSSNVLQSGTRFGVVFTAKEKVKRIVFGLNGSKIDTTVAISVDLKVGAKYIISCNLLNSTQGSIEWNDMMLEEGTTIAAYEPYHEQTVTLPYTLNAIPVNSGGNVTIDGQQYIADYVDVERGKLVRMCKEVNALDYEWTDRYKGYVSIDYGILPDCVHSDNVTFAKSTHDYYTSFQDKWSDKNTVIFLVSDQNRGVRITYNSQIQSNYSNLAEFKEWLKSQADNGTPLKFVYALVTPEEIDLTEEEIKAFKALVTYYPTTNISINSEQLDGYTVFNYPISMKNGWDYVKKQLNDNRDYIYNMDTKTQDIDTQSAEAYVNSEYAVALTELEV